MHPDKKYHCVKLWERKQLLMHMPPQGFGNICDHLVDTLNWGCIKMALPERLQDPHCPEALGGEGLMECHWIQGY